MIDHYTVPMVPPSPSPPPNGPLSDLITVVVVLPVMIGLTVFSFCLGFIALVEVFCATGVPPVATTCALGIVAVYLHMWADDVGLMPVISLAASVVALITAAPTALFTRHNGEASVVFCIALVMLISAVQVVKRNKIQRTGKGWIADFLSVYAFLSIGTYFLGSLSLTVLLLFGGNVNLFEWEFVTIHNFPFVGLECCQVADAGPEQLCRTE